MVILFSGQYIGCWKSIYPHRINSLTVTLKYSFKAIILWKIFKYAIWINDNYIIFISRSRKWQSILLVSKTLAKYFQWMIICNVLKTWIYNIDGYSIISSLQGELMSWYLLSFIRKLNFSSLFKYLFHQLYYAQVYFLPLLIVYSHQYHSWTEHGK